MITHQESIRLQILVEDVTQSAVNLNDARRRHDKATAAFADYVEKLEKKREESK